MPKTNTKHGDCGFNKIEKGWATEHESSTSLRQIISSFFTLVKKYFSRGQRKDEAALTGTFVQTYQPLSFSLFLSLALVHLAKLSVCTSVYVTRSWSPSSRPRPLHLKPPNGAPVMVMWSLTHTLKKTTDAKKKKKFMHNVSELKILYYFNILHS